MTPPRHFASDNNAPVCPEAWEAMARANYGHAPGYGDDSWTRRACDLIRDLFETDCEVFLVFNGTAANALALAALAAPHHAVLCHGHAHVIRDECGAPSFFGGGLQLEPLPGPLGKITPADVEAAVRGHFPLHASKPAAVTVTQATEFGTVYTPAELAALGEACRAHGLGFHMDGARFANAVAALDVAPRELTAAAGVDVLSFGATKNGAAIGEAVVWFNRERAREFEYRVKQAGQLASKMRHLAAGWVGLLEHGAWLRHAAHANRMAALLDDLISPLPGTRRLFPREANALFVDLPAPVIARLHAAGWRFYVFLGETGCRLMCSWDTTEQEVRTFAAAMRAALQAGQASSCTRLSQAPGSFSAS